MTPIHDNTTADTLNLGSLWQDSNLTFQMLILRRITGTMLCLLSNIGMKKDNYSGRWIVSLVRSVNKTDEDNFKIRPYCKACGWVDYHVPRFKMCFLWKIRNYLWTNTKYVFIQSTGSGFLHILSISQAIYGYHFKRKLKLSFISIYQYIFVHPRKYWNVFQPVCVPSMGRDDKQKAPGLANTAGGVEVPIQAKKSILWPLGQIVQQRFHVVEWLFSVL